MVGLKNQRKNIYEYQVCPMCPMCPIGAIIYFREGLKNTPFNSLHCKENKKIYFLKLNLLWPESSKVDLEEELLEAFLIFLCLALLTTITPLANFCSLDNLGGGGGDLKKTSVIEFTTWFHEFSKYESTNFFTNTSQLKKQTNLIGQKKAFLFLSFEHLRKSKQI